jgi:hypothetical protein
LARDEFQAFAGSLGGTGDAVLPAVAPPSIGKVMPVIQRDSSLARNSAPYPISHPVPSVPSYVRSLRALRISGVMPRDVTIGV